MNIENIWQQYGSSLRTLLRAKISDPADVEDLLQEILIKTHNHIGQLRSRDKLRPWLFQMARNSAHDFYRKRGQHADIEPQDLWYEGDDDQVQQQLSRCVLPFISALPPRTAALLQAIDIDGRSQKEYAAETGIGYSALKSRVQRGRSQLRGLFEDCCHLELDRHGNVLGYQSKSGGCESCPPPSARQKPEPAAYHSQVDTKKAR